MPLQVAVGYASLTGPRERNEDFCGLATPDGLELENKGVIAAVADGIGGHKGGREAAEYTVRGLLADYYATPDTWSVPHAIETVMTALNRWVIAEAGRNAELAGMATTLSALVLRGRRYYTAHIGDSRIYRVQGGRLAALTVDHIWEHPELRNVLSRAVGLDPRVLLDFSDGELTVDDRFLLVSDGVWGVLPDTLIAAVLIDHPEPQAAAAALTSLALAQGGRDNATAVVVDVLALPPDSLRDSLERAARLPLPHSLRVGHELDGLVVEEILHDARETLLYRVRSRRSGQQLVLKTLQPVMAGDADTTASLLMEEWRARRVVSPFFAQVVPAEDPSGLYYLMTWHAGATLQARLAAGQHFPAGEVVRLGSALLKGIATLHRLAIVHRDIKTGNLHLGQDGLLRILDLGVALSLGERKPDDPVGPAGTPSYMAMPAGVWVLGFVSMLMDISSEMIHSLLPLFMVGTLGASVLAVGLIEGLAESTALIVKVFSGALSDYLGKRKGLALLGYALGASDQAGVRAGAGRRRSSSARLIDRVGKGIRGAPRDALVADIAPPACAAPPSGCASRSTPWAPSPARCSPPG
jgi:serine/threonine protein phosphatase PrpC